MLELLPCRWRGEQLTAGRWACASPKLVVGQEGVPEEICARCYCLDHEPAPPVSPVKPCEHLGRRVRDDNGLIVQRACLPCGDKLLDVFSCDHPATADQVTLLDCRECNYSPEKRRRRVDVADLISFFDRVCLINLAKRKDRLSAFMDRARVEGWALAPPIVTPAIEGDVVGVPPYFREGGGAWGCLRSHVGILERCLMDGVGSVVVFEDDVEWSLDCWANVALFLSRVPADWSMLMLGGQHMQTPADVAPGVVRCFNTQRTHAYAIRGPAIKSLLRSWYTASVHLDWVMGGDWMRGWPVYAPSPFLFGQSGGKSDISGRLNNALFWNPPTNATVVALQAPPAVARALRSHGMHFGFRRSADGVDVGLERLVMAGCRSEDLQSWLSTLLWETASMRGRVTAVWHPQLDLRLLERVHAGPVRYVAGETVEDCLAGLAGLDLVRSLASSHVLVLRASRATVEALPGFHRGYWLDDATGEDRGQQLAAGRDTVANLVKWSKHTFEECERMNAVPLVWHPVLTAAHARAAFPDRSVIELAADSVEAVQQYWSANV